MTLASRLDHQSSKPLFDGMLVFKYALILLTLYNLVFPGFTRYSCNSRRLGPSCDCTGKFWNLLWQHGRRGFSTTGYAGSRRYSRLYGRVGWKITYAYFVHNYDSVGLDYEGWEFGRLFGRRACAVASIAVKPPPQDAVKPQIFTYQHVWMDL